jgi:hypothetical protein
VPWIATTGLIGMMLLIELDEDDPQEMTRKD